MPTKAVSSSVMKVGKKGGGKHWTAAEVAARKKAADALKRKDDQKLKPPPQLGAAAKKIWDQKIKQLAGVDLLDALDAECLGIFCVAMVNYNELSKKTRKDIDDHRAMQAYMRIIAQYADKLGFTPAARARLIKKKAEEPEDKFGKMFDQ